MDSKSSGTENQTIGSNTLGPISKPEKSSSSATGLPKPEVVKSCAEFYEKWLPNELDAFGDISTLLNPECVQEIVDNRKNEVCANVALITTRALTKSGLTKMHHCVLI